MITEKSTGPKALEKFSPWCARAEIVHEHHARFARAQQTQCELERTKFFGAIDQHGVALFKKLRQHFARIAKQALHILIGRKFV